MTGRKADVIVAANVAAEVARRLVKPGKENYTVTEMISKAVADFNCKPIQGVQSHLMQKLVFDGEKCIVLNPDEDHKKSIEKCTFEMYEAWLIDIVVSTGSGKAKDFPARTTVFKKNETIYHLKLKASRSNCHLYILLFKNSIMRSRQSSRNIPSISELLRTSSQLDTPSLSALRTM